MKEKEEEEEKNEWRGKNNHPTNKKSAIHSHHNHDHDSLVSRTTILHPLLPSQLYPPVRNLNLKHTPAFPPTIATLLAPTHHALLALFQLAQALHLLEHMLEQVLAAHNVKMAFDLWIFLCKAVDFVL